MSEWIGGGDPNTRTNTEYPEYDRGIELPPVMQQPIKDDWSFSKPGRPIPELTEKWGEVADLAIVMMGEVRDGVWWKLLTKKVE